MRPSTIILPVVAATFVNGTCFTGGEDWASQKPKAVEQLHLACRLKFAETTFHRGQEELGTCYDLGGGKYVNFNLKYVGHHDTRTPTYHECVNGFSKEINGCSMGGASQYTNWRYTYVKLENKNSLCTIARVMGNSQLTHI